MCIRDRASLACRYGLGRWPWELWRQWTAAPPVDQARRLLGVDATADRSTIIAAHRRLIASFHPDRGRDARLVHEANDARDLLLARLPQGD